MVIMVKIGKYLVLNLWSHITMMSVILSMITPIMFPNSKRLYQLMYEVYLFYEEKKKTGREHIKSIPIQFIEMFRLELLGVNRISLLS